MSKFMTEFKEFIAKGNVVDLAVGVVIGAAFGKIVSALVDDIVMPLLSLISGGVSVADMKWVIKEAVTDASGAVVTAETALKYGDFIQTVIDFLIIALAIFIMLKALMKLQKKLGFSKSEEKK